MLLFFSQLCVFILCDQLPECGGEWLPAVLEDSVESLNSPGRVHDWPRMGQVLTSERINCDPGEGAYGRTYQHLLTSQLEWERRITRAKASEVGAIWPKVSIPPLGH